MRHLTTLIVALLLNACTNIPSMQYCDKVSYSRTGNLIHVEADCRAPVDIGMPALPKL